MPAVYAHDRFGKLVCEKLTGDLKELIQKYYTQYEIGLQGPDIFFFCRPFNGPVNRYGNHLHHISALSFFEHARSVVEKCGRGSREYAYLLGFIGHFILDSECHAYVEEMVAKTGVGHLEIESEFEKLLLKMDGENPLTFPVANLIPADTMTVKAIKPFYAANMTEDIIRLSLKDMRMVKRIFTTANPLKQNLFNTIVRVAGIEKEWKGLMNQRKDHPACKESNDGLLNRFQNAVDIAVKMMYYFDESLYKDVPLHTRFDRDFE